MTTKKKGKKVDGKLVVSLEDCGLNNCHFVREYKF